ncbi:hypothetical protein JIG36_18205 [Actinoplanes sp. LDG1-06]|uniref:Uncharacterized protein n=1 Tax=Paractinoplanes ovalisporus TaxID=2810368 RepID=A0ABS2ACE1_9ACTN|nr:hypothetical protein [Actinoplanes ovalisporus]MBM2617492.1 hypothetical protein [Actinoplanes ovalisporus]
MSETPVRPSEILNDDEADLLRRALNEWLGPARCSDEMAYAMGFADADDLVRGVRDLKRALKADEPIAPVDWARMLLSTEVVFVSDLVGSGYEWSTTTGRSDEGTIRLLRGLQRQLGKVIKPYYGKRPA